MGVNKMTQTQQYQTGPALTGPTQTPIIYERPQGLWLEDFLTHSKNICDIVGQDAGRDASGLITLHILDRLGGRNWELIEGRFPSPVFPHVSCSGKDSLYVNVNRKNQYYEALITLGAGGVNIVIDQITPPGEFPMWSRAVGFKVSVRSTEDWSPSPEFLGRVERAYKAIQQYVAAIDKQ